MSQHFCVYDTSVGLDVATCACMHISIGISVHTDAKGCKSIKMNPETVVCGIDRTSLKSRNCPLGGATVLDCALSGIVNFGVGSTGALCHALWLDFL